MLVYLFKNIDENCLFNINSFRLQIPSVGLHTTFVFGFFVAGGATVLFGSLEYLPVLNQTSPEVEYCVLAFIIRSVQSVGQMAFATAALTLLSTAFPGTTSAVMVGEDFSIVTLGTIFSAPSFRITVSVDCFQLEHSGIFI